MGIFLIFLCLACVLSFLFWFFFLAHSVELEVSLEVESDKDPISKLRFEECGNVVGVILRMEEGFVVGSPTGLLVFRPTSLLELLCENSVGGGPVLASVSNVDSVEVILQEVSGHVNAIVRMVREYEEYHNSTAAVMVSDRLAEDVRPAPAHDNFPGTRQDWMIHECDRAISQEKTTARILALLAGRLDLVVVCRGWQCHLMVRSTPMLFLTLKRG